ncbi:hypothetical protein CBX98_03860 [Vibrio sp. T9]|nr:hypothetical protein CBX98_03860 [Vibrio sp. T9]
MDKIKSLERDEKKYRGIAGGTIPRVSMTPSLAAGVTCCHATSGIHLRGSPLDGVTIREVTYFSYKNNAMLI